MANVKELNINSTTYDIVGKAVEDQNNSGTPVKVWTGTKAEYDLLTPDPNTIYNITDEDMPNDFVKKSGDTMTGDLNIQKVGSSFLNLSNTNVTKGTNPASAQYTEIRFNDSSNDSIWANTRLGCISHETRTDGTSKLSFQASQFVVGSSTQATLWVQETAAGVASCAFPHTDCVDGLFVKKDVTVASGVSLNGSTNATYTLSDLPNDGNNYLVWINVEAVTGNTSGNYINVKIGSSLITNACLCKARTRTASTVETGGYIVIPVSSDRKIVLEKSTNWNGTTNIYMHGYRRIGTNS